MKTISQYIYFILAATAQTTEYLDVGNGVCRIDGDDAKGYGYWGSGNPTDDDDAGRMCNNDPKCMGFWNHSSGGYQFFCSEATTLCNGGPKGTIIKPSDLKGSGTQGGGSCFIKSTSKLNHKQCT